MSVETPTKSSGTTEKELVKKIKGFDALAMSIGNGNSEGVSEQRMSHRFVNHFYFFCCLFFALCFTTLHQSGVLPKG